jgi:hypothetical protein
MKFSVSLPTLTKVLAAVFLIFVLGACAPGQLDENLPSPSFPVPTINPLFSSAPSATPRVTGNLTTPAPAQEAGGIANPTNTLAATAALQAESSPPSAPGPTSTAIPTDTPALTPTNTPAPTEVYRRVLIFDEAISEDWALRYSEQMVYNEKDNTVSHNGTYSVSFRPQADNARLLFGPRQTATESYPRNDVVGVSFWLYSGEQELNPSDLLVSILGSNRFPFYFPDDRSVESDSEPVFPEVPLNYLDGKTPIPPQTWIEVIVRLADLPDNPDYEYVTGIQLKNAAGFRNQLNIDQVELLMAPVGE